jgi:hypothetical protein
MRFERALASVGEVDRGLPSAAGRPDRPLDDQVGAVVPLPDSDRVPARVHRKLGHPSRKPSPPHKAVRRPATHDNGKEGFLISSTRTFDGVVAEHVGAVNSPNEGAIVVTFDEDALVNDYFTARDGKIVSLIVIRNTPAH